MDDKTRLHEIELLLDAQISNRNERRKLVREANRIRSRLDGRDHRTFATGKAGFVGGVPSEIRPLQQQKRKGLDILSVISNYTNKQEVE